MKKRNVCFIGNISDKLDGQTVKTKILYDELISNSGWNICLVNTVDKKRHPFKVLFKMILNVLKCKDIIIIVSQNGRRFFFPILYFSVHLFKKRIYHNVIGGCLQEDAKEYSNFPKYLNSFCVNWVESHLMKDELNKLGIMNVEVLPNFKKLDNIKNININGKVTFKFCTFSRVIKEKGIEDAINAVVEINKKKQRCTLDIYGSIDDSYKEEFEKIMQKAPREINYKGVIPFSKSSTVLHEYYALLFPTYWPGEGCPGTVIDAFASGLPVIATNWNCNSEFIDNFKTGIIYPNDGINSLKEAIIWSMAHPKDMQKMSLACNKESKKYEPAINVKKMIEFINEERK